MAVVSKWMSIELTIVCDSKSILLEIFDCSFSVFCIDSIIDVAWANVEVIAHEFHFHPRPPHFALSFPCTLCKLWTNQQHRAGNPLGRKQFVCEMWWKFCANQIDMQQLLKMKTTTLNINYANLNRSRFYTRHPVCIEWILNEFAWFDLNIIYPFECITMAPRITQYAPVGFHFPYGL